MEKKRFEILFQIPDKLPFSKQPRGSLRAREGGGGAFGRKFLEFGVETFPC